MLNRLAAIESSKDATARQCQRPHWQAACAIGLPNRRGQRARPIHSPEIRSCIHPRLRCKRSRSFREGGGQGDSGPSPNRVTRNTVTVISLIQTAYVIFADGQNRAASSVQMPPIEKAPAWISSDLYTIEATVGARPANRRCSGPMMQSLLEDRFHLKLHRETRSGPAFELTVAKGGSKLKTNNGVCSVDVPSTAAPRDATSGQPGPGFSGGRVSSPSQPDQPCRLRFNLRDGPNQLFLSSATPIDQFCSYLSPASRPHDRRPDGTQRQVRYPPRLLTGSAQPRTRRCRPE